MNGFVPGARVVARKQIAIGASQLSGGHKKIIQKGCDGVVITSRQSKSGNDSIRVVVQFNHSSDPSGVLVTCSQEMIALL